MVGSVTRKQSASVVYFRGVADHAKRAQAGIGVRILHGAGSGRGGSSISAESVPFCLKRQGYSGLLHLSQVNNVSREGKILLARVRHTIKYAF